MTERIPFHYLEFRIHSHATEDEDKVITAVRNAFGDVELKREILSGFHGNPIILLHGKIMTRRDIIRFFEKMKHSDIEHILSEIEKRMDKDLLFHLRIDKEAAYGGEIAFSHEGDYIDIAVKIESYPADWGKAYNIISNFFEHIKDI